MQHTPCSAVWFGVRGRLLAACATLASSSIACNTRTEPSSWNAYPDPRQIAARLARQSEVDRVARGRYLVEHVAGCGGCHSPKGPDGHADAEHRLSGVDCFVDVDRRDPGRGCVSTPNLTQHETGLKNRSDEEIADMFMRGRRPDGKALHPFMPYRFFANLRAADADAIVAYLRTVPGVDHTSASSQPPFTPPAEPEPPVLDAQIPWPREDYTEPAAALRGRYLAGSVAGCVECHSPRGAHGPDLTRAFQGGGRFGRDALGLPASYPDAVYAPNLTPHATGIAGYRVEDIVRALRHGEDPNQPGEALCRPMPAGPAGALGGMTEQDARDIGHYLLSLPPAQHEVPEDCRPGEARQLAASTEPAALGAARAPGELWLSDLGVYADLERGEPARGALAFEPRFALWSDGTSKRRWLLLPPGAQIGTLDDDHWEFPVGTLAVKEFSFAERRLETRVIARTGPKARDYWFGAFVWNEDASDAVFVAEGQHDLHGSGHDAPSAKQCGVCHAGEPGRILGFSAVQQPDVDPALVTHLHPARPPAWDGTTQNALGYLHANCGSCHNPGGSARPDTDLDLRLSIHDRELGATGARRTAIGQRLQGPPGAGPELRIAAGAPARSAILVRMSQRGTALQMPPLASEQPDATGLRTVRAWIGTL